MPVDAAEVAVPPATGQSVTADMLNAPTTPADAGIAPAGAAANAAEEERLRVKLGMANSQARDAKNEAAATRKQLEQLQAQLEAMQAAAQAGAAKQLEEQGQFKQLWEDAKATIRARDAQLAELQSQLGSVQQAAEQERLRAAALGELSRANALAPEQLYGLLAQQLRTDGDGRVVVLAGGAEVPLADHLAGLRNPSSGWTHHFAAGSARGMGAAPQGASVAPGVDNPYRSGNLTAAIALEMQNPELAAALKAEATRG